MHRCRTTVHNWIQKADLQPAEGRNPTHVAVDETVIQDTDQRCWLYAAVNHSPSGFSWGYAGSGPAQLGLALLLDHDDDEVALAEHMAFKNEEVSQLECTGADGCWRLTGGEIEAMVGTETRELIAP